MIVELIGVGTELLIRNILKPSEYLADKLR